ncbi:hypothetical protein [Vibrio sp. ED002]|uniref:hypothetical protein n=1 Tax=Vibrio sp. ED002 TaxID=2785123 RepID=UPI00200F8116|nr:hypothetical protein [Vibrio sp. ED002]UQA52683.1 hypothetical protein ITG12_23000 [Vibrio sp. ED002]
MIEVVSAIAYNGTPSVDAKTEERVWALEAGSAWDTSSDNVKKFVQKSNLKIDQGGKEYSTFKSNPSNHEFPSLLGSYIKGDLTFEDFHSTFAEKKLAPHLKNSRLEQGAVIVFVHFRVRQDPVVIVQEDGTEEVQNPDEELEIVKEHFSVLMVKNTGALKFTEDFQIAETDVIDLKQFVQGCQVDLIRFNTQETQEGQEEDEVDNFLTFISGGGDVREYFKEALFAEALITNKASSANVEKALVDFWKENKEEFGTRKIRDQINSSVYTFSEGHKGQVVTLAQISAIVDGCIPDENAELRGTFETFANEGAYEINDEFELKTNIIKELVYVNLDVGFAKLILEKRSIGKFTDPDDFQFKFNSDTGEVTFTTTIEDPREIQKINSILENE